MHNIFLRSNSPMSILISSRFHTIGTNSQYIAAGGQATGEVNLWNITKSRRLASMKVFQGMKTVRNSVWQRSCKSERRNTTGSGVTKGPNPSTDLDPPPSRIWTPPKKRTLLTFLPIMNFSYEVLQCLFKLRVAAAQFSNN